MDPRYKRRAMLSFGPNTQGGRDPVAVEDGRAVFWKGNPGDIRYGEPVECIVADSQYVSFALPAFAPPEEADFAEGGSDQPPQARPSRDRPTTAKGPTKTGLKRTQLTAVKEVAEKRARKVAKAEVKPVAAALASTERSLRETRTQVDALRSSAATAIEGAAEAGATVAGFKKAFDDLASRISSAEADLRALKAAARAALGAIPKPVPVDASNPTDEEIQRQIVYQLHQTKCYGDKHTSGEHFRGGYHAKLPQKRIDAAIKALYGRGILRRHAKTPEQYSLNADAKPLIAAILGVPDRDFGEDESQDYGIIARGARSNGTPASKDDDRFVERGPFENTVRVLRERLESLEAANRDLFAATMSKHDGQALSAQVGRAQDRLEELQKAMEEQAAEIALLKKRIIEANAKGGSEGAMDERGSPADPE
jgi:predicted  nucleic acid-binding Zn-ribbon protein